jgi:hypothetical protein
MRKQVRLPDPRLLEFLKPYGEAVTQLALDTREFLLRQEPEAFELLYDAYSAVAIGFSITDRPSDAFCHVAVYSRYINLGFNWGAVLPDPKKRLAGTGNQVRHIRIERKHDLADPEIGEFVHLAILNARSKATGISKLKLEPQTIVRGNYPNKRRPK